MHKRLCYDGVRKMGIGPSERRTMKIEAFRLVRQTENGDEMLEGDDMRRAVNRIAAYHDVPCAVIVTELQRGLIVRTCGVHYYAPDYMGKAAVA